jgi:hypothetical protein
MDISSFLACPGSSSKDTPGLALGEWAEVSSRGEAIGLVQSLAQDLGKDSLACGSDKAAETNHERCPS